MRSLVAVAIALGLVAASSVVAVSIGASRYDPKDSAVTAAEQTVVTAVRVTKPSGGEKTTDSIRPVSVSLDTRMLTMGNGEAFTLKATYDNARSADGAVFSSDNTDAVSVDPATGQITAKAPGYATVTVQSPNGLTAKCYVTVKNAPNYVAFSTHSVALQKGEQAVFTLLPAGGDEGLAKGSFSSNNDKVVEVTKSGAVTAKGPGTATVTATSFNGKSASVTVTVLDDTGYTEKTTIANATLRSDAGWRYPAVETVPAGSAVRQYGVSDDGRWLKVRYNDQYGWIYNKALEEVTNYTDFTLETLPVMADDLIFDIGTDKRAIFDFVYNISYSNSEDDTTENLCVDYFRTVKGSCYHHAAMLCYLYNRCGYETLRLNGISAYDHVNEHSWCLSKTEEGWRHVDAQLFTIRTADEQYFITDADYVWFTWDTSAYPAAV